MTTDTTDSTHSETADNIDRRAGRIIAEFASLDEPIARYRRLVELGDDLLRLPAEERTEENRLPGCQYAVWLALRYDCEADALFFRVDSDARIVRGLAGLIIRVIDGQSPRDIAAAEFGFLDTIGLRAQLSVQRGNGLAALVEEVRRRARAVLEQ